jgi:hypothetical protein
LNRLSIIVTGGQITSATILTASWAQSPFADHYKLEQLQTNGTWIRSSIHALSVSYPNPSAGVTFVFHVRAVDSSGGSASNFTANDLATTISFATIQAGVTPVAFSQFDQILTAINAIRAAGNGAPKTWRNILDDLPSSAPAAAPGIVISAVHVRALRNAMNTALSNVSVSTPGYTDPTLTSGMVIKAVHILELQQRAQ